MTPARKIHFLIHVPFEGPAIISDWAEKRGAGITYTRFYEKDPLPRITTVDMLVIMGGPMNVYDFHHYPWMEEEIRWVGSFVESGRPALGICLGAQLIAASLGAEVTPGPHREIGWHELQFLPALGDFRIFRELPPSGKVFHWHGDTFRIPEGATRIACSKAFPNQGFIYRNALAFQFHLEATLSSVRQLADNCRDEMIPGPFVQSEEEFLREVRYYGANQRLMFRFLDYLWGLIDK